jgi:hypothetical protein
MGTVNEMSDNIKSFVERNPYISTGARGAALGAGTFAAVAAVKEVMDMIEDRKKKKKAKKPSLSSDTIVITLPDKSDEKTASARDLVLEEAKKHTTKPTDGAWRQARNSDGTFASGWELDLCGDEGDEKTAQAKEKYNPPWYQEGLDVGLGGASAVLGAGLGWYVAQRTYDYLKKKRLKREIEAAQKEYIDFLTNEKTAAIEGSYNRGFFHRLGSGAIEYGPFDKEGLQTWGKYSTGAVTSTAILLALASTYLTKKFLDQKFNDLDTKTTINDVPKVNNIVFKTASAEEIPLTPADALAMVKFAEIMLEADSILMEKEAGFGGMMFDYAVNNPDARVGNPDTLREMALEGLFSGMGMGGDDPKKWTYNGNVDKNNLSAEQLRDLRNVHTLFNEDNDAAMKLFLSEKYKAQRENMARQYLNNWYGNSWLGKTFGTDTGFGRLMQALLGWFGNYYANSEWGGKNMYNRMMSRIDNAAPGSNAPSPYPKATPPSKPVNTQETGTDGEDDNDPMHGFEEPSVDQPAAETAPEAQTPEPYPFANDTIGAWEEEQQKKIGPWGSAPAEQPAAAQEQYPLANDPLGEWQEQQQDKIDWTNGYNTTGTPEQAMDEYAYNPMNYDSRGFMYEEGSPDPDAVKARNAQFAAQREPWEIELEQLEKDMQAAKWPEPAKAQSAQAIPVQQPAGGVQNNKYSPAGGLVPATSTLPPPAPPSQGSEPPDPVAVNNGVGTPDFSDLPDKYRPNGFKKGAGFLDSKLLAAASRLAVTTDTRNDTLDDKLDKLLSAQQNNSSASKKNKKNDTGIKIIAADKNARDAINDKRKVIEQVLRELKAQGKI